MSAGSGGTSKRPAQARHLSTQGLPIAETGHYDVTRHVTSAGRCFRKDQKKIVYLNTGACRTVKITGQIWKRYKGSETGGSYLDENHSNSRSWSSGTVKQVSFLFPDESELSKCQQRFSETYGPSLVTLVKECMFQKAPTTAALHSRLTYKIVARFGAQKLQSHTCLFDTVARSNLISKCFLKKKLLPKIKKQQLLRLCTATKKHRLARWAYLVVYINCWIKGSSIVSNVCKLSSWGFSWNFIHRQVYPEKLLKRKESPTTAFVTITHTYKQPVCVKTSRSKS